MRMSKCQSANRAPMVFNYLITSFMCVHAEKGHFNVYILTHKDVNSIKSDEKLPRLKVLWVMRKSDSVATRHEANVSSATHQETETSINYDLFTRRGRDTTETSTERDIHSSHLSAASEVKDMQNSDAED